MVNASSSKSNLQVNGPGGTYHIQPEPHSDVRQICCNAPHCTALHCNAPQTLCNTLQHTATHCNTLQHKASSHCKEIYYRRHTNPRTPPPEHTHANPLLPSQTLLLSSQSHTPPHQHTPSHQYTHTHTNTHTSG